MPLIALEGVDGSGKTTLLETLRQSGIPFWSLSRTSKPKSLGEFDELLEWINQYPVGRLLVIDRHPLISESVYGPILRGKSLINLIPPKIINDSYRRISGVVYCRPPDSVIQGNVQVKPQMEGVREKLWGLIDRYDSVMETLENDGTPVFRYDFSIHTMDQIKAFITTGER